MNLFTSVSPSRGDKIFLICEWVRRSDFWDGVASGESTVWMRDWVEVMADEPRERNWEAVVAMEERFM